MSARGSAPGSKAHAQTTGDNLGKLNERLAVIDAAQARLTGMTEEVVSLKDILANKQARGAFGQGRMEAIVRDGLPSGAYEFQFTLSNKARPDCVIRLPGDPRLLAVDAKFPLEAFTAFKRARAATRRARRAARVRADVGKHVKDIAERYLLPGETQDIALMFVPSESIYSDLVEHFDDVVQKAHRARVVIVSPSLMMMAIQVDAGDPARRAHARRGARDPGRGRQAPERRAPPRRAGRQARSAFPPGAGRPRGVSAAAPGSRGGRAHRRHGFRPRRTRRRAGHVEPGAAGGVRNRAREAGARRTGSTLMNDEAKAVRPLALDEAGAGGRLGRSGQQGGFAFAPSFRKG